MGNRLTGELTQEALQMALQPRRPKPGLLHHSDRGSQYAATAYQQQLRAAGMTTSMSPRKGNCWDNACVESFFSTVKRELIHPRLYRTREEARHEIFEYLEVFYNRQRRHSTLGSRPPADFEARVAVA
jgi:putative transposase